MLLERGLVESRELARNLILDGKVLADGRQVLKPASLVESASNLRIVTPPQYVSRGGLKLEKALAGFGVDVEGKVALDVGASTGGFTDCLLQRGARSVIAVDVGYGQFAWRLRRDPRVTILERTDIRALSPVDLPELADVVAVDVSFISATRITGVLRDLMKNDGVAIVLVKPQFEAGREKVGKGGIVRQPAVHEEVLLRLVDHYRNFGARLRGLAHSPITGSDGNIEFFMYLDFQGEDRANLNEHIRAGVPEVVVLAHRELGRGRGYAKA